MKFLPLVIYNHRKDESGARYVIHVTIMTTVVAYLFDQISLVTEKTDLSAVCDSPSGDHECNHGDDNKLNDDLGEIPSLQEASTAV